MERFFARGWEKSLRQSFDRHYRMFRTEDELKARPAHSEVRSHGLPVARVSGLGSVEVNLFLS